MIDRPKAPNILEQIALELRLFSINVTGNEINKRYDYSNNSLDLSGLGLNTIPRSVECLTNLRELDLSENEFSEHDIIRNLDTITSLNNLISIKFNENKIKAIPSELFQIQNLQVLFLSYNEITSIDPTSINASRNLEGIFLKHNKIAEIPCINAPLLREFDLGGNLITNIPECLFSLPLLERLNLSFNKIHSIPYQKTIQNHLIWLNLSHNEIMHVPSTLLKFEKLRDLNLSDNLIAKIPTFLDAHKRLLKLHLQNNSFRLTNRGRSKKYFRKIHGVRF